tara:strand:+ start:467 stop:3634 length:3168 start_codon:yes stop_codon:yes gene_type:complete
MNKPVIYKRWKVWKRILLLFLLLPILLVIIAVGTIYIKQDDIVQGLISTLNKDFKGKIEVKDSHITPFDNFPYVSVDLEGVKIFESKIDSSVIVVDVSEAFLGFDLTTIFQGDLSINDIKLKDGAIDLVQHIDGSLNIENALSSQVYVKDVNEEFHLAIHEIELQNIDIHKLNEENNLIFDALIYEADAKFVTSPQHVYVFFDSKFELNLIDNGDTTFIQHKHFELHTKLDYRTEEEILTLQPTKIQLENSEFEMEGTINFKDDVNLDIEVKGNKENYDLIFAMAPDKLIPVLERYENSGNLFFNLHVKGKTSHGHSASVNASFGCENGFFKHKIRNSKIDDLNFIGTYTNGTNRNLQTSQLTIKDFSANPDEGQLSANLKVTNFEDPEVNFQVKTAFELNFLTDFFNLKDIKDLSGSVELEMNFHDIININAPEHAISKLNESYQTELKIDKLKFKYGEYPTPIKNLDLLIEMKGHKAIIKNCNLQIGSSDIELHGQISDLPAIIHQTNKPIQTKLNIKSNLLNLYELTGFDSTAINEQIKNLRLQLNFKSSAKTLTAFENLPVGEFYIEDLYAELQHYPHAFHDFNADILIDKENLNILDFEGMVDESDFLFTGKLKHYDLWFKDKLLGETEIDFNFKAEQLRLEDIIAYDGENYVPEEYRHEELNDFKFHSNFKLHFNDSLESIDFNLDHFRAKMKIHPLKLKNFKGRVHYEKEHLLVEDFSGEIGESDLKTTIHYYLGKDELVKKRDNFFSFSSGFLDIDELINYNALPGKETKGEAHDSTFNLYELPFTNMSFFIDVKKLNYHQHGLSNFHTKMHTTPNHFLYIDTLYTSLAGGNMTTKGYFNGSNPDLIYFSPDMYLQKIDLDQVLLKFDNFGQDEIISENLHGEFTGHITGKIHMHTDLVPIIEDSEIHLDAHIENGRLENYGLLKDFSEYFKDKNLESVQFDTLENKIDMVNGVITVPKMTINSSLGFLEISGIQDANFNYEYNIRIPWKMVTQAAASKLFKRKQNSSNDNSKEGIQYGTKKTKYVMLNLKGDSVDYKVSLLKKESI